MEKKTARKPKLPVFAATITPDQLSLGIVPEAAQAGRHQHRILDGRSGIVKEHFEADMQRLRQGLAPGRIEPKVALAQPAVSPSEMHLRMRESIDPRSGHVVTAKAAPERAAAPMAMIDASHPFHPDNQLAAAMKKLGHRQ